MQSYIALLFPYTLSVLGMVGLYIGKTFEQVKNRPLYIIDGEAAPPQEPRLSSFPARL